MNEETFKLAATIKKELNVLNDLRKENNVNSFHPKDNLGLTEEEMIAFPRASVNFNEYIGHANEILHVPRQYRHYPIDLLD